MGLLLGSSNRDCAMWNSVMKRADKRLGATCYLSPKKRPRGGGGDCRIFEEIYFKGGRSIDREHAGKHTRVLLVAYGSTSCSNKSAVKAPKGLPLDTGEVGKSYIW